MERIQVKPRKKWEKIIRDQGLIHNTSVHPITGKQVHYWNEDVAYSFTLKEIEFLEEATIKLHEMYMETARFLAEEQKNNNSPFKQLFIPDYAIEYAIESLQRGDKDVYGQFDLAYVNNPFGDPIVKMLEYNNDAPNGLWEASIIQWQWLQDAYPEWDQWNSIHESLVSRWAYLKTYYPTEYLHFAHTDLDKTGEDLMTISYMRDTAEQAGWVTKGIEMSQIGLGENDKFYDTDANVIESIFKLYPWDYMVDEGFGEKICETKPNRWYEPAWKMLISTKVSLAALWYLYPNNDLLLPTYINHPQHMRDYVKKPVHGRESENITIFLDNKNITGYLTDNWGETGYVYQQFFPLENHIGINGEANYPILNSWVVNGDPVGLGILESDGLITDHYCRFIPNIIRG